MEEKTLKKMREELEAIKIVLNNHRQCINDVIRVVMELGISIEVNLSGKGVDDSDANIIIEDKKGGRV